MSEKVIEHVLDAELVVNLGDNFVLSELDAALEMSDIHSAAHGHRRVVITITVDDEEIETSL